MRRNNPCRPELHLWIDSQSNACSIAADSWIWKTDNSIPDSQAVARMESQTANAELCTLGNRGPAAPRCLCKRRLSFQPTAGCRPCRQIARDIPQRRQSPAEAIKRPGQSHAGATPHRGPLRRCRYMERHRSAAQSHLHRGRLSVLAGNAVRIAMPVPAIRFIVRLPAFLFLKLASIRSKRAA